MRKVCRRPETDYRLQQLHATNLTLTNQQKTSTDPSAAIAPKVINSPTETMQKQHNPDVAPVSHVNVSSAVQTTNSESKIAVTNPGISLSGAAAAFTNH